MHCTNYGLEMNSPTALKFSTSSHDLMVIFIAIACLESLAKPKYFRILGDCLLEKGILDEYCVGKKVGTWDEFG